LTLSFLQFLILYKSIIYSSGITSKGWVLTYAFLLLLGVKIEEKSTGTINKFIKIVHS